MLTKDDLFQIEQIVDRVVEKRLAPLEQRMDYLEKRMDSLEQRMDSLEQKMNSLEGRMNRLEKDARKIKRDLGVVIKVFDNETIDHTHRLDKVERRLKISN